MNISSNYSSKILPQRFSPQFRNNTNPQEDVPENKINNDLGQTAVYNKSLVNFRGRNIRLTKKDLAFLTGLTSTFALSAVAVDKLKNVLADFLNDNDFISMDDMAGEDNLDLQIKLADKINETTKLDDTDYYKLMDRVIDRCYLPNQGTRNEADMQKSINEIENEDDTKFFEQLVKQSFSIVKENDGKCLDAIANTFEFDDKKKAKLEEIVHDFLRKNELVSLRGFRMTDRMDLLQDMNEIIVKEFGLSEDDGLLLYGELLNRAFSKDTTYEPNITPLDRDFETSTRDKGIFSRIIEQNGIKIQDGVKIYNALAQDAYQNGYKSVFELFGDGGDVSGLKNTNEVLNSDAFAPKKTDLLIDLDCAAKNLTAEVVAMNLDEEDSMTRNLQIDAFVCDLDKLYNFSKNDLKGFKRFLLNSKYDFGNKENTAKIAYELSEYLNREEDFGKIAQIIENVSSMSQDDLNLCGFRYIKLLNEKK